MGGSRLQASALAALFALLVSSLAGCNLAAITIKAQVDGTKEFTDLHGNEFADPELVGPILATSVIQSEGFLYYAPDYEPLLVSTIFANVAYGVAWLGAAADEAQLAGKFDESEHLTKRSGVLFGRALVLTKRMLRLRDKGFDDAINGGLEKFKVWVDENFYEKKDAEVLLIAGSAYFVSMIKSDEGLAAAVDVPYARYMVERSVELDEGFQGGQGLTVLGIYECTIPAMVGGNPKLGLELMTRASKLTNRRNHGVLVQMAGRCAVALQDRKMFHDLLTEVIEASDVPEWRLPNKLARHEAERLLKQSEDLFYE